LNYTRISTHKSGSYALKHIPITFARHKRIGTTRFEHATPWSQTRCSTKLSYVPIVKMLSFEDKNKYTMLNT
jgi:hypothetical protein